MYNTPKVLKLPGGTLVKHPAEEFTWILLGERLQNRLQRSMDEGKIKKN